MNAAAAEGVRLIAGLVLATFVSTSVGQTPPLPRIGWVISGTADNSRHTVQALRAALRTKDWWTAAT